MSTNRQEDEVSDETQSDGYLSWRDGLPTKPDVDMLLKAFPELKEGDQIPYEEVSAILGVDKGSNRFRTVTNRWRDRLVESGVVVYCDTGRAFYVATADQVSGQTYSTLKFIGRKAKGHRRKLSATRPKDDVQRSIIEHQGRLMLAVEKDSKKARMNLLPSTKVAETPKTLPPAARS